VRIVVGDGGVGDVGGWVNKKRAEFVCEDISSTQSGIVCVVDFFEVFHECSRGEEFLFLFILLQKPVLLTIRTRFMGPLDICRKAQITLVIVNWITTLIMLVDCKFAKHQNR